MNFFRTNLNYIYKGVVLGLLLLIGAFLGTLLFKNDKIDGAEKAIKPTSIEEEQVLDVVEPECFYVDIKGAVNNPGVYQACDNNIVNDVVVMADGLKSNASTKYLNLSKKLEAEMIIYIYTKTEVTKLEKSQVIDDECECSVKNIDSCVKNGSSIIITDKENKNEEILDVKISINEARKEKLMELNGIGEAKATAIIEYRTTHGKFEKIEDIKNVNGISESLYEKIKNNIKL